MNKQEQSNIDHSPQPFSQDSLQGWHTKSVDTLRQLEENLQLWLDLRGHLSELSDKIIGQQQELLQVAEKYLDHSNGLDAAILLLSVDSLCRKLEVVTGPFSDSTPTPSNEMEK